MTIHIAIRPAGATSGGAHHDIPGEGKIDTKPEAEAALAFLPEGSANTVLAIIGQGTRAEYTRAQLIEIRDRPAANTPATDGAMIPGIGTSHGVGIEGSGVAGLGEHSHGGGGARLTYRAGIPLVTGDHSLHLDAVLGADVGHFSRNYKTPGGEDVRSAFTAGSAVAGADLRWTPPWLSQRLWAGLGVRGLVGGFGTAASTMASLPASCTPGNVGRAECEPGAGSRSADTGATGLFSPRLGAARGTSGFVAGLEIPLTIGARVARGEWGSVDIFGGPAFSVKFLSPKDGGGITSTGISGFLGVAGRFGGADSLRPRPAEMPAAAVTPPPPPDKDGDGVLDAVDQCPNEPGDADNKGCKKYVVKLTSVNAVRNGVEIDSPDVEVDEPFKVRVAVSGPMEVAVGFKDAKGTITPCTARHEANGDVNASYTVPPNLKAGKYSLVASFKDLRTGLVTTTLEKDIKVLEKVKAQIVTGSFAASQPPVIQHAMVNGVEKFEVTSVVEGFKGGKSMGRLESKDIKNGDKSWTLSQEKPGILIPVSAPGGRWKDDIVYKVTLLDKSGEQVWWAQFMVGQAPQGGGRVVRIK